MNVCFRDARVSIETIKAIIANGGGNIDMNGELANLKTGYMVSVDAHEKRVDASADIHILDAQFNSYFDRVQHYNIIAGECAYFGVWLEGDSLVFDVSVRISYGYGGESALDTAYAFAHRHNQRAIYDVAAQAVLPTI